MLVLVFYTRLILPTGDIWYNQHSVCLPSVQYTPIVFPDLKVSQLALNPCYFPTVAESVLMFTSHNITSFVKRHI